MGRNIGFQTWALLAVAAASCCLLLSFAWAEDVPRGYQSQSPYSQEIATIGAVQGDTSIQRAGEAKFKRVQAKAPLYISDFLATGKASKIWWKGSGEGASGSATWAPFPEITHGSLGEQSVFGFLSFQRISLSSKFVGQVRKGIVRFIKKLPNTDPPSSFAIATPTAWIEVVPTDRAADFMVETHDESRTTVTVLWGEVRVKNISEELTKERILTSCQEVDVEKDQEPGEVRWVSTDTMKNLIKRTTIPNTLPTDVPSCERIKAEIIRVPGVVYIPPVGVVVPIPIPVPEPTPPPGEKCPCPPGQYWDPATKECGCPCPPNYQLVRGRGCVPCRSAVNNIGHPPGATDGGNGPAQVLGKSSTNGRTGTNGSDHPNRPSSCNCECQCPEGQVLLPGRGCVPQCPEGFSVTYDASEYPPYRCPVCRQGEEPLKPVGCEDDQQCGKCSHCVQGNCFPVLCRTGYVLNLQTCECEPVDGRVPRGCTGDEQCSPCQQCREGQCASVIVCGPKERLNLETCQCEPAGSKLCPGIVCGPEQKLNVDTCQCESSATPVIPRPNRPETPEIQSFTGTPPECQANSDCGSGQICRKGKCVKKPPSRSISKPSSGEENVELPNLLQESDQSIPSGGIGIGIGGGLGIGGTPGGGRVPRGSTGGPQRIRRPGKPN